MKKGILAVVGMLLFGCSNADGLKDNDVKMIQEKPWIRTMDGYSEELILDKKGTFYYYDPTSGNAIDDYDLCDTYTIDQNNKELHLHCEASKVVDTIRIKKIGKHELILDFAGNKRKFTQKNK